MRLSNACQGLKDGDSLCYDGDYVGKVCSLHPIQLVKTVRMRVHHAMNLLLEKDLNMKIMVLMRDPRAVRYVRDSLTKHNVVLLEALGQGEDGAPSLLAAP